MSILLVLAAASAAYFPPTADDAARAMSDRLFGGVEQASLDPHKPGFDLAVRIERCRFNNSFDVRGPGGLTILVAGHECVMSVSRRLGPEYRLQGFFHHDGLSWRYVGPTDEPFIAETTAYDNFN